MPKIKIPSKYYLYKLKDKQHDIWEKVESSYNKSYILKQKKLFETNYPAKYRIFKFESKRR